MRSSSSVKTRTCNIFSRQPIFAVAFVVGNSITITQVIRTDDPNGITCTLYFSTLDATWIMEIKKQQGFDYFCILKTFYQMDGAKVQQLLGTLLADDMGIDIRKTLHVPNKDIFYILKFIMGCESANDRFLSIHTLLWVSVTSIVM